MKFETAILVFTFLTIFFSLAVQADGQKNPGRLYRIEIKNRYGFIDRTGKVIVPAQFAEAGEFSDGLAALQENGRFGFIDKTGKFVIRPEFLRAEAFSDGLALVLRPGGENDNGVWCFIDKTGRRVFDVDPGSRPAAFSDGLAVAVRDKKAGFIGKTGKFVIEPKFDAAFAFSEGLAKVRVGKKYGYIDKTGTLVIAPQFPQPSTADILGRPHPTDYDSPFRDGRASIQTGEKFEWSVIDRTGQALFAPSAENFAPFAYSEGLLRFRTQYTEGFMNRDGRVAVKPVWHQVGDFSEGLAPVATADDCPDELDRCWGYIDRAGNVVVKPRFASAAEFKGDLAWVIRRINKDSIMYFKGGYINKTGNFVWSIADD